MKSENCWLRRYNEAKEWLPSRIAQLNDSSSELNIMPKVLSDPIQAIDRLRLHFDEINKLAIRYHQHDNIELVDGLFEVIAYDSANDGAQARPDFVRFTDKIKVTTESLNIYVTKLMSSNAADALTVHFEIFDAERNPVGFTVFEAPEMGRGSKCCVIVFLKPLIAGTSYDTVTIVQEQHVFGAMRPLFSFGEDYLSVGCDQAPFARKLETRLGVPRSFGPLSTEDGTQNGMKTLQLDDVTRMGLDQPTVNSTVVASGIKGLPQDFAVYSRMATDVRRGEAFRVIYRKQKFK
jgi:hypothetical protein